MDSEAEILEESEDENVFEACAIAGAGRSKAKPDAVAATRALFTDNDILI